MGFNKFMHRCTVKILEEANETFSKFKRKVSRDPKNTSIVIDLLDYIYLYKWYVLLAINWATKYRAIEYKRMVEKGTTGASSRSLSIYFIS